MKPTTPFLLSLCLTLFMACSDKNLHNADAEAETTARPRAKFEPEDGKVILFVGQEQEAIGGLDDYNDGYLDHFETPAGFTMYTKIRPGDESFGFQITGLCGVTNTDDWGDGPSNMQMQVDDPDFEHMALAIGLEMVNHEGEVARGEQDSLVLALGNWIKSLGQRPVFLRIGYEFDGHSWNHYNREDYLVAYRRIKDLYDSLEITNIAYVWQSTGWVTPPDLLEEWYPGDEYVDWCSYSFFSRWDEAKMIEFARQKGKPVFIAEATPTISDHSVKFDGQTREVILSNPEQARLAWDLWFTPFFKTINDNEDVVKAISYINANWRVRPMWKDNPTFQKVDARLQTSDYIRKKWEAVISSSKYLKSSPELFDQLTTN